jgi:hypothetical protein
VHAEGSSVQQLATRHSLVWKGSFDMQLNDRDLMKVTYTVFFFGIQIRDLDNYLASYTFIKRTSFHISMQNPQLVQTMTINVASVKHVSQEVPLYMAKALDSYHHHHQYHYYYHHRYYYYYYLYWWW